MKEEELWFKILPIQKGDRVKIIRVPKCYKETFGRAIRRKNATVLDVLSDGTLWIKCDVSWKGENQFYVFRGDYKVLNEHER